MAFSPCLLPTTSNPSWSSFSTSKWFNNGSGGFIVKRIVGNFSFLALLLKLLFGASVYGFLKSFGISISVIATMLMIFIMQETGALQIVSKVIKSQVKGTEIQALYIGIGFGSFLTSLGVVTPALFPPLLVTMGFTPVSAVAIAVLGYDPTTSFSLLSIPITLPAQIGGLNAYEFAFKISLFLPIVSTGFAFAILWLVGGKASMRKGAVPAIYLHVWLLAFTLLRRHFS